MQICVVLRRGWMLKSSNNLEIATEYWNGSTQKNGTVLGRRLSQRECGSQRECCRPSPMIWVWCLTLTWRKPDVLVCICIPSTSYSKMEDRDKRISQFLGQLAPQARSLASETRAVLFEQGEGSVLILESCPLITTDAPWCLDAPNI